MEIDRQLGPPGGRNAGHRMYCEAVLLLVSSSSFFARRSSWLPLIRISIAVIPGTGVTHVSGEAGAYRCRAS